jgi:hypothetical protein
VWWTLSAHLAISALVNIRLVWGHWASPFTETILGVSAAALALGCLAPSRTFLSGDEASNIKGVHFWLALGVIITPLVGNAAVKGWVPIGIGKYLVMSGYFILHAPILIHRWKQIRREKRDRPRLEADAVRRWAVYEATGRLPEAGCAS